MNTTTVNLRADAQAEGRRLTMVRALAVRRGRARSFDDSDPWIARARGYRRRSLAGRLLLVWHVGCEDSSGRTAARMIVALLACVGPVPDDRALRSWTRDFADAVEAHLPDAIADLFQARHREQIETSRARAGARLVRERAIAAHVSESIARAASSYQAGLFDHRAEREQRTSAAAAHRLEDQLRARVLAAAGATAVSPSRPRLVLVLRP